MQRNVHAGSYAGQMTERKPGGMSFETWIDRQIREAQERGEFDDLPGKGKPLKGIDQPHDELWWVKQLIERENLSYTPPGLALRRLAEEALDRIKTMTSEASVREALEAVNVRIRNANRMPTDGPPSNLMPFDVERVVAKWRDARTADGLTA